MLYIAGIAAIFGGICSIGNEKESHMQVWMPWALIGVGVVLVLIAKFTRDDES